MRLQVALQCTSNLIHSVPSSRCRYLDFSTRLLDSVRSGLLLLEIYFQFSYVLYCRHLPIRVGRLVALEPYTSATPGLVEDAAG
jgi:hypothetical protein